MEEVKQRRHQNLIQGSMILGVATLLVKIIGAVYKIPLGWILGGVGSGYFSVAYAVYLPLSPLAMSGLPVAVSRMVAESVSENRFKDARNLLKLAKKVFAVTGVVCFAIMMIAVPLYVNKVGDSGDMLPMLVISPSIIFCCIMSTYRGYYEGLRNMFPTGISQVIEALGKLLIGLAIALAVKVALASEFASNGTIMGKLIQPDGSAATLEKVAEKAMMPYVAAAAILGITLGSAFGALFLVIRHKRVGDKFTEVELALSPEPRSNRVMLKALVTIAVPIVLGSMVSQVASLVDLVIVKAQLKSVVASGSQLVRESYGNILGNYTDGDLPNFLYGCYRNYAYSLSNLAPTVTTVIGVSAIPVLATAWSAHDRTGVKENMELSIRLSSIIAFPAGLGLFALAQPILSLLYPTQLEEVTVAAPVLQILGLASIFMSINVPVTSMLQAIGKQNIPVYNMLIGVILKVGINYALVGIPSINVVGAPVGTAVCYGFILIANLIALAKHAKVGLNIVSTIIKPLIAGGLCAASAYGVYRLMSHLRGTGSLTTLSAVVAAVVVYVLAIGFLKVLGRNDVLMLPKGQKIAKILEKIGWIE